MNKYNCIIFIKKNCKYCDQFVKIVRKKFILTKIIFDHEKNIKNKIKKKTDFIFCFRSKIILKKNILNKAKLYCINFHPGPPQYRGIGCLNYAIYNNEKFYGATCHIINEKIDNGKIIDVKYFKILKKDDLQTILNKTYKSMIALSKKLFMKIKNNSEISFILSNKYKWSKTIKSKKYLEKFYEIKLNSSKTNFNKKVRATVIGKYRPYIKFYNKKFILDI